MTLNQLLRKNTSYCLDIVDILGVVGKKFAFLLEKVNEGMSWCEPVS
jgi:hypothetical protein